MVYMVVVKPYSKAYVIRELPANVLLGENFWNLVKNINVQEGVVELANGALVRTLAHAMKKEIPVAGGSTKEAVKDKWYQS